MTSQTTIDLSHRNVSELDFSHNQHSTSSAPTTSRTVLFNDDENDHQNIIEKKQQQQLTVQERSLLARALILDASHNSITKLIGLTIFERLTVLDLSHNCLYIPNICVKKPSSSSKKVGRHDHADEYRPPSRIQQKQNGATPKKQDGGGGGGIASGLLVGGRLGGRKIVLDATPNRNAPGGTNSYILVGSRAVPNASSSAVDIPEDDDDDTESDHEAADEHYRGVDNELWWITQLPKSIVSLNLSHNEIAVEIDTTTNQNNAETNADRNVLLDGWVAATFLHHLTSLQILDLSHNFISTKSTSTTSQSTTSESQKKQLLPSAESPPLVWNPNTGYPHLPPPSHTPTPSTLELLSLAHNRGITNIDSSLLAGLDALTELHLEGTSVRRQPFPSSSTSSSSKGTSQQRRRHSTTIDTDALSDNLPCLMTLHLKGTPLDVEMQATPAIHRQFIEELANVGVRDLSLDIPSSKASSPSSPANSRPAQQQHKAASTAKQVVASSSSPPSRHHRDIVVKPATFVISPTQQQQDEDDDVSSSISSSSLSSSSSSTLTPSEYSFEDVETAAVDFPSKDDDLSQSNQSHNTTDEDDEEEDEECGSDTEAHDQKHILELLLKGGHKQHQSEGRNDDLTPTALRSSRTSNYSDGYNTNTKSTRNTGETEEERLLEKAAALEQQVLDAKARVFALRQLSAEQEDFLRATRKNVCEDLKEMSELKVAVTTLAKTHQERGHLLSKRQRELKHAGVTSRRFQEKLLVQEQLNIEKKMQRAEQRKRGLESLHEGRQMEQSGGLNISRFSSGSPINNAVSAHRKSSSSSSPIRNSKVSPRTRFVYDEFGNPTTASSSPRRATTSHNEASAVLQRMSPPHKGGAGSVSPAGRRGVLNHHPSSPPRNNKDDEDGSGSSLSSDSHYRNASSCHRYNNGGGGREDEDEVLAVDTTTEIDTSHMEDATSPRTPPDARHSITTANIVNRGPGGIVVSGKNHLQVVTTHDDEGSFSHSGGGAADTSVASTSQLDVSDGRAVSYAEVFNSMSSMQPDYPQPSARLDDPARRVRNDSARKSYRDASSLQQQHERSMSCASSNRSGSVGGGGRAGSAATTATYEASGILKSFNHHIDPNNSATATSTQRLSQSQREKAPYYRHAVQAHPFVNSSQNTIAVKAPHGGSKPFSLRTVLVDADRFSKHSRTTTDDFPLTSAMLATKTTHQQRTDRASSASTPRRGSSGNSFSSTAPNPSHGLLKESRELLQMLSRNLYHSNSGPEAGTVAAVTSGMGGSRGGGAGYTPDIRAQYGNAATHRPAPTSSPGSRVASSSVSHKNARHVSSTYQAHGSVAADRGSMVLEQAVSAPRSAPRLQ